MNNTVIRPHPLTIFYLMRSYWLVFVAPPIRMLLQYVFVKEVQIILLSETVAVAITLLLAFFRWFFTKIEVYNDVWVIKKGLLIKTCSVIALSGASGIYIRRNFIDVIFKSASVFINTQTDNTEQNNLKIKFKTGDLEKIFNNSCTENVYPIRTRRNFCRFFVISLWIAFLIIFCLLTAFIYFKTVQILIIFVINMYYTAVCYHNYKNGGLYFDNNISVIGSKGLLLYNFYCKKEKIGAIKIYQTPADRKFKTCKIKLFEYSEGAKGIKVRNADLNDTVAKINKAFNLNVNV